MRNRHPHVLALLFIALVGNLLHPNVAYAQEPTSAHAKAVLIRRFLELTRASDLALLAMESAIPGQRSANPQLPREFWDQLSLRARQQASHLVDLLVPVYDAQFTVGQLKQLVAFYESPLGRHLIEVQPVIATQSVEAGRQWGAQIGAEVARDLTRGGAPLPSRP